MQIALDVLEPFQRIARRRLQAQHFGAPRILVFRKRRRHGRLAAQIICHRDRALHGEFSSGADGEMRRGGGVAHQHDIFVRPCLAQHAREIQPGRAAHMCRVRHQSVAAEIFGKNCLAGAAVLVLAHRPEAEFLPGVVGAFDDEGRGVGVELIGVRPDPAVLGLLEDEGKGVVELLPRAEPDELAFAHIDVRLEDLGKRRARPRVQSIGGDHEIVRGHVRLGIGNLRLERHLHAKLVGSLLQQEEQPPAADPAESMACRDGADALVADGDIIPVGEMISNPCRAHRVVGGEVVERLRRQHDTPAERVVRLVALEHGDLVRGVAALHRDGEVEAGGAGAENSNLHLSSPQS